MEIETETETVVDGSKQQGLAKSRKKKKGALFKLVEKKRLSSDGGSEYGSTVSLQKVSADTNSPDKNGQNEQTTNDINEQTRNTGNAIEQTTTKDISNNVHISVSQKAEKELDDVFDLKPDKHVPRPKPRRISVKNETEKNEKSSQRLEKQKEALLALEGGTVVSIYDKVESTPTGRKKRDPSPTSGLKTKKGSDSDEPKRELFPTDRTGNNKTNSLVGDVKPNIGLLGDLPPLGGGISTQLKDVGELSPIPMDIGNDSDDENKDKVNDGLISKNAPSDATVHRFRALKMSPDRCKSEESLKNAKFDPKPPPNPRSGRMLSTKGEKRNREANSSGEEPDIEAKKQLSEVNMLTNTSVEMPQKDTKEATVTVDKIEEMEITPQEKSMKDATVQKGLSVHPDALFDPGPSISGVDVNHSMNTDAQKDSKSSSVIGAAVDMTEHSNKGVDTNNSDKKLSIDNIDNLSTDLKKSVSATSSGKKKSGKAKKGKILPSKNLLELAPLDGSDSSPGKTSIDTIGSASDLKAINDNYKEVLKSDIVHSKKTSAVSPKKLGDVMPPVKGFGGSLEAVIPEPKANAGKLSPIQPKHLPPPLPHDIKSSSLRTAYKADTSYQMNKYFARSFSTQMERASSMEMGSQQSFNTTAVLHPLSTREARDRMKHGNIGASLLSSSELDRYFPDRRVGLWVGSWNMGESKDCKDPLDDFLLPEVSEYVQDIYAIGTQENAMSKKEWEVLMQETIGPSHVLFHSTSHGALHLAVFIKRDLIWFCTVPEDDLVQTRAVTMVKTKGAIGIGFQFFGTSFLFINSHFAPGDGKKKDRQDDYTRIIKHMNLPKTGNTGSPNGSSSDVTTRFDHVFWMGDLNFRIEVYKGKQAVEDIVRCITEQEHPNFEDLVSGDQLTQLIVEGSIFQGFQEGRINFRPTYKYDVGSDTYDTSSKMRIPSYTDRVLFRAKKKNSIVCTYYDSPISLKISDHRPVFAIFEAAVKPARECNQPLAAGQFDRAVYTEANKRRSLKVEVVKTLQKDKSSKVCAIQ